MSTEPRAPAPPTGWFGVNPHDTAGTLRDDPYPALARLREEHPVHRTPDGYYRALRHADVTRVLRELPVGVRTTDGRLPGVDESELPRRFMLLQDPPNHTRLRRLVARAFTPPSIDRLAPHVEELVDGLLDRVASAGEFDVIADLARPLPSTVICEMLGVPVADRALFTDWTAHVTHLLVPSLMTPETNARAMLAVQGLATYMTALVEERRGRLGDDMLSTLIRAEADGDQLSHEELLTQSIGLLVAGFETTIGLIGNGVRQLLLHPGELAKLRERPGLVGAAVEECLRFDGPIPGTRRVLHEDAVVNGYHLERDTEVVLSLAAAHRDPRVFADPDRFDIERDHRSHLAFGGGIHFCLGAHLARMEAQIAIGKLIQRIPGLTLVSDQPEWGESLFRIQGRLRVRAA
ncbi:MAG: cytochrome P450 [Deltaproteobacteria bacterium]|nr:cytochrome P450 [Deltaproteobacteria bacterium]